MAKQKKQPQIQQGGGLEEPELPWHEMWIPPAGEVVLTLIDVIPALPQQVMHIAGELPEILHIPDFEIGG